MLFIVHIIISSANLWDEAFRSLPQNYIQLCKTWKWKQLCDHEWKAGSVTACHTYVSFQKLALYSRNRYLERNTRKAILIYENCFSCVWYDIILSSRFEARLCFTDILYLVRNHSSGAWNTISLTLWALLGTGLRALLSTFQISVHNFAQFGLAMIL